MNRNRRQEKKTLNEVHDSAVRLGRAPGGRAPGVAGNSNPVISTIEVERTQVDGEGYTVRPFMLGVDALGDARRPLSVEGKVIDYGS